MKVEVREDSIFISGYVNAVERLSKPIRETWKGKVREFVEKIKAGVFRTALKRNKKVLVLLNHDNSRVLANTEDGSAILEEDNIGLRAEVTITDAEVVEKGKKGLLSGWSFGFIANDDDEEERSNQLPIRTVTDLELLEVSILDENHRPAYYGTSIEAREGGARVVEIRAEAFEQEQEQTTINIDELASIVASKVIEALKAETKADEPEAEEEPQAEEQTEETTEAEPEAETEPEAEAEEKAEEPTEEEPTEEETEAKPEAEEEAEEENRSIDYSQWESRLAEVMK